MNDNFTFVVSWEPGKDSVCSHFTSRSAAEREFESLKQNSKLEKVILFGPAAPKASWEPAAVAELVAENNKRIAKEAEAAANAERDKAKADLAQAEADAKEAKAKLKELAAKE